MTKTAYPDYQPIYLAIPGKLTPDELERLLRATFNWHSKRPLEVNDQATYDYYLSNGVDELTAQLNERQITVLVLRLGLGGRESITLEDVGAYFKRTKERIRQIEWKALAKMRDAQDWRIAGTKAQAQRALFTPIEELDLSIRIQNCLKLAGINFVEELEAMTEAQVLEATNSNFNTRSLDELVYSMHRMWRHLATK